MCAGLGNLGDAGGNGVQIDVSTGRQQRLLIEDRHALEAALEERAAGLFLAVDQQRARTLGTIVYTLRGHERDVVELLGNHDPGGPVPTNCDLNSSQ